MDLARPSLLLALLMCACDPLRPVAAEFCANGLDDNQDGVIDCADPNCASLPICSEDAQTQPKLPGWWNEVDPSKESSTSDTNSWCQDVPPSDPELGRYGCSLTEDDCDVGERCIVLSQMHRFVDTACIAQGCRQVEDSCSDGILADECPSGTLCLGLPHKCQSEPCCVDLCDRQNPHCTDCRPLSTVYSDTTDTLTNIGVCNN